MGVEANHPLHRQWVREWRLARAVCGGERAVKSKGIREETLPMLSGHRKRRTEYEQYVRGAYFFPAAGRFRDGLVGLLFQAQPAIDGPASLARLLEDVTGSDTPCTAREYVRTQLGRELCTVGPTGTLVDFPLRDAPGSGISDSEAETALPRDLSVRQAEARGIMPTLTRYRAEQIVNWLVERDGPRSRSLLVVLEEQATEEGDRFSRGKIRQRRVLDLARPTRAEDLARMPEDGSRLAYRVEIWRPTDNRGDWERVSQHFPRMRGRLMSEIPFDVVDPEGNEVGGGVGAEDWSDASMRPPLGDVISINLAHFRNSALYENGLLFVGSPQPYITGYDVERELGVANWERGGVDLPRTRVADISRDLEPHEDAREWHLGSATIMLIQAPDAQPGILSASAENLSALRQAMDKKVDDMVVVGGRILSRDKLAAEAARTEEIRRQGERSVVAALGANLSAAATRSLSRAARWMGVDAGVEVRVSTDYVATLSPADALTYSELFVRGHIARSDMTDAFRRGRVLMPHRTDDEIRAELAADPPSALPGGEPLPEL